MLNRVTGATQSAIKRHLSWIFRVTSTRPVMVFAAFVFFVALSVVSILTTRFEADVFKLFPARQGALRLFLDSLQWTGSANEAYFLLEGEKERLVPEAEAFAGRLKELRVDGAPAFRRVIYRIYDPSEARAFADFIGYAVVHPGSFLEPADVPAYLGRLAPKAMDEALLRTGTELASQAGAGLRDLVVADPLALRDLVTPRLKRGSQALDLDPNSPYFLSRDGRVLIIIAEPARPVQDMVFARKLAKGINQAREGARVRISCAGAHLSAVIDEAAMKGDILSCILSSLVVVLLLFFATYRRVLPTLLLPVIIGGGVVLALGVAGAFLPSIHIISFAFMALIIGLGTDYSVHLYDRYHMERCAGLTPEEALRLAVTDTGHGIFTAATTTAMPFLTLAITDVRALSELGILVGLGVLFSLYTTLFLLPPLLLFMERLSPRFVYRPLPGFGLAALWRGSRRRGRLVKVVSILAVAAFCIMACYTTFEGELKNLQPRHSEAFLTQEKIERHLSLSPKQMLVAVEGKDLGDVLARGARVDLLVERYRQRGELAAFSSLGQLVNDDTARAEVSRQIDQGLAGRDPGRALKDALERQGFAVEPFEGTIAGLVSLRGNGSSLSTEAITRLAASPLKGAVDRHLIRDAAGYHLLVHLFYKGAEFPQDAFLKELSAIDPSARATSVDLVSRQLAADVKQSFLWGFVIGGALVIFLLLSHFSSMLGLFASFYPVFAGIAAMLGIMAVSGMGINFMNAMVLVTILGMGNDYGMHIAHRVEGKDEPEREFVQAGRAVLLSALTTIAGFGSLAFADYGALASIGWATNYGVGATMIFALVSLPAFLVAGRRRSPAPGREIRP
ncbi:RND efflux transporter [Geobacter metallireducens RCH3]|uniref:Exporter, putative n=1 Tax=Geobacter metallireducens (strain ATCC 53774 / DSM 7210 / GS-15) TaxID=269799 RepID=Q39UZ4_GEOMG|nr:MMPL family transporter [Geobacter metallireducens]ABB31930.1 exporter, putative [Geobacter metallireducens GS-15]EHP84968.1 RND efflux transporter [Geobacter metallireducens RCH3]